MTSGLPQTPAPAEDIWPELVVFDERIPGTRRVATFVFVLVFVAVFVLGSRDPIVSGVVILGGGWMLVHDLFSVFGWEHVILTDTQLRLERRLFGRALVARLRMMLALD